MVPSFQNQIQMMSFIKQFPKGAPFKDYLRDDFNFQVTEQLEEHEYENMWKYFVQGTFKNLQGQDLIDYVKKSIHEFNEKSPNQEDKGATGDRNMSDTKPVRGVRKGAKVSGDVKLTKDAENRFWCYVGEDLLVNTPQLSYVRHRLNEFNLDTGVCDQFEKTPVAVVV